MRIVLTSLSILAAVFGALMAVALVHGVMTDAFRDGGGMAIVILQVWGAMAATLALLLGGIAFALGRGKVPRRTFGAKVGMGLGVLTLATLVGMLAF